MKNRAINEKSENKANKWVFGVGIMLIGVILGATGCYFAVMPIPMQIFAAKNSPVEAIVNSEMVSETEIEEKHNQIETTEIIQKEVKEEMASGVIEPTEMRRVKALAASKKKENETILEAENVEKTDAEKKMEETTASLTINLCPDNTTGQESPVYVDEKTEPCEAVPESVDMLSLPTVIEVPGEKYDIREGDYSGELYQFLRAPASAVVVAFPTFTNSGGRIFDNHWQTVAFSYRDTTISQIEISQCDPDKYSLLGVKVGMDKETARSILAANGYPWDYFADDGGYWMHSADNNEEAEILLLNGKVLTMVVRDLTQAPSWALNAGL